LKKGIRFQRFPFYNLGSPDGMLNRILLPIVLAFLSYRFINLQKKNAIKFKRLSQEGSLFVVIR